MQLVNTGLMKHPVNYLVLWSMALLFFFVGHLLISYFSGKHPGDTTSPNANAGGPGTVPASDEA